MSPTLPHPPYPPHLPSAYRIESCDPLLGNLLPLQSRKSLFVDYSLAVAIAVKSVVDPTRQQVRVVHVPSGEVVFQTRPAPLN